VKARALRSSLRLKTPPRPRPKVSDMKPPTWKPTLVPAWMLQRWCGRSGHAYTVSVLTIDGDERPGTFVIDPLVTCDNCGAEVPDTYLEMIKNDLAAGVMEL
jgi:hypothetical protein